MTREEKIEHFRYWQRKCKRLDEEAKLARDVWYSASGADIGFEAKAYHQVEWEGVRAKQEFAASQLMAAAYAIVLEDLGDPT